MSDITFRTPASGDTFGPGEEIVVDVEFSQPVVVEGEPRLVLMMGDQPRSTDLVWAYRPGETARRWIGFRYFVKASDRDDDGISIPANAMRLNGGSIQDSGGQDADLSHEEVADDPALKVNGRLDAAPTITKVSHGSRPRSSDTYRRGESLVVSVEFSEIVDVTGAPLLTVRVGSENRQADLHARYGSRLDFAYTVQSSDVDADGFSVPGDAVTVNGGAIRDGDGNDADLTHDALPDDPRHKVNGASSDVPTVSQVVLLGLPVGRDPYVAGDTLFAGVVFSENVHVTGSPQFTLQVGARERRASYLPDVRAAALLPPWSGVHAPRGDDHVVWFEYVVQPTDVDDNGVSAPANALARNGGSIRGVADDSDARLGHEALADNPRLKVDGSRSDEERATVRRLFVNQPPRGAFRGGDVITVTLAWTEVVRVTGAPRIALRIGTQTRFATFREYTFRANLLFDYVVDESDRDDNGISIDADALELNGGTIRDNSGNDANLDLGYLAFNDNPNYRVDGRLTPVPALPAGAALALLVALLGGGWRRLARRTACWQ